MLHNRNLAMRKAIISTEIVKALKHYFYTYKQFDFYYIPSEHHILPDVFECPSCYKSR